MTTESINTRRWQFSLKRALAGVGSLCIALSSIGIYDVFPLLAVFLGLNMFCVAIGVFAGGRLGIIFGSIVGLWASCALYVVLFCWTLMNM